VKPSRLPPGVQDRKYALVYSPLRFLILAAGAFALLACGQRREESVRTPDAATLPKGTAAFRVPEVDQIKDTVLRASVVRGRAILEATRDSLPKNVGSSLRCVTCHFSDGTARDALPWVGVYSRFPQVRARSARLDLLEDRINDCFERSLNGRALKAESREMHDIVAYLAYISTDVPVGARIDGQGLPKVDPLPGDTVRGAAVFGAQCSRCHGAGGEGTAVAPPLWGPKSYNKGAGMTRISVLAAFVHQLMPIDRPRTLTAQQAFDVASYINSRPRPEFAPRVHDWPNGGVPSDLGYPLPLREKHSVAR
jgi:thiosulfate dehydrogenase